MFVIVEKINPFIKWFFCLNELFFIGVAEGKPLFCSSLRFASRFSSKESAEDCIRHFNLKKVYVLEVFLSNGN